jgi:hypothetical protein
MSESSQTVPAPESNEGIPSPGISPDPGVVPPGGGPQTYDSVYSLLYDSGSQTVFLEDLINADVYASIEWVTFWNLTVNHFGQQRAQRAALSLTSGRPMRVSWRDQKIGLVPSSPFRAMDVMSQALGMKAIEAVQRAGESPDPRDVEGVRRALVASLDF